MSDAVSRLRDWYHVPVVGAVICFMLWVRVQNYGAFIREDGTPIFPAVDTWYHWRTTLYSVENWPRTMPYDPWTHYPYGSYVGQFGTLFDQLIATAALAVGLGSPSEETVALVFVLTPAVLAALVAIPTYLLGARLGGRLGGVTAVLLLALFPGTFLQRSTAGFGQHHVAEVLFMTTAVLAMAVALSIAEREKPVYEQLTDRDLKGMARPVGSAALAGFALALYLWTWPPGALLIGIFGAFFTIALAADYLRGESPDHLAFVGAVALAVTGVLLLLTMETTRISATSQGPLQPLLALAVAAGCVFMAWLARVWDSRGLDRRLYPATVLALIGLVTAVVALALPEVFETVRHNVERTLLFGQSDTSLTIAEAQAVDNVPAHAFGEYGFAFFTAIAGLFALALAPFFGGRYRAERLLVVVWSLFIIAAAFTQLRFNYYLAVVVAVLNAAFVGYLWNWIDLRGTDLTSTNGIRSLAGYQALTIVAVVLLLFVPLALPIGMPTAVDVGAAAQPGGDAIKWEGSNEWLAENTPEQGSYGGAEGDNLDYYGTYDIPENEDFEYSEGTYGVMSWWDYGHLITVQGERIPHANPFQEGARNAAAFFTADSEDRAELLLDALPAAAGESLHEHTDEELADLADERTSQEESEEMRYVMIDDAMAAGKFPAIATWAEPEYESYLEPTEIDVGEGETATVQGFGESYEETTLSRLYYDDADEMEGYRLVHESPEQTQFVSVAGQTGDGDWVRLFTNREYTIQFQFQLQQLLEDPTLDIDDIQLFDEREASSVKTYERVEGAQLVGEAEPGETVTAELELTAQESERTFTYTQETTAGEDGSFEMTVPYATDNDLGTEEGYTNSDVIAEGEYEITAANETASAEVSEEAIYEGETVEATFSETEGTNEDEEATGEGDEEPDAAGESEMADDEDADESD